ncbi:MAG TPA: cytochrome c oxidase subunit II [Chitinophagaceae bacterium]|nr:cytochrome c oxidase subunit II [Chitinophagaceae bacterium]
MQTVFIVAILLLGFLITFQIAKASEYVAVLRGEEKAKKQTNKVNAFLLLAFLIVGLIGVYYCNETLKGRILGEAASNHGKHIDTMFHITLVLTGIVFVITQIALFWFSYKYQQSDDRKAYYYPHNNKLEVIWTVIPAIALTVLVGFGIFYWFKITGDAPKNAMEVEIVGSQFKWEFRYPGHDGPGGKGVFGKKYFKKITGDNPLGQIWEDPANHDDVYVTGEPMHLVVDKPVRLIINSKDVIHDVGLVHFRMKMDAVPGTPTTMWFTPTKTTKQMAQELGKANFVYEISCDQMCGKGHTGMRGELIVETQEEFDAWMATKQALYSKLFEKKQPAASDTTHTVDSTAKQVTAVLNK